MYRTSVVLCPLPPFIESPLAPLLLATVHPSSLLRAPDEESRRRETDRFIKDLRKVARPLSW